MTQIAKNVGFNTVAALTAAATGFLSSIIAARILGPSAYGEFAFLIWMFATVVLLADPGVSSATEKYVSEFEGVQRRSIANSLTLVLLAAQASIGLAAGLLLINFGPAITGFLKQPSTFPYLIVFGLGVPTALLAMALRARLAGFQRYGLISMVTVLSSITTLAGTVALLKNGLGVRGLIWLSVSVYALQLLLFAGLVWKQHNPWPLAPIPFSLIRRVALYCLGVSAWTSIDAILFQRSATFFLGRYSTADQIGYYGLAYGIAGTLVMTLPLAMAGVLMPAMSRYFGAGDRVAMQRVYSTATRYLVILSLPLSFGCIAVAKPLVGILYGSDYLAMAMPLRILLFSSAVSAMAGPGSALFLALGKPYLAAVWGIPLALLNLALAFALVPYHGATGAALANSACQVLGVAVATSYLLHFEHFRLPLSAILRTVLAASISAGLAYLVAQQTTGWPGLLAAITLGAVVYVVALIFSGALDASDFLLLRQMTNVLPNRIGIIVGKLVNLSEEASRRSGRFSRVRAF